MLEYIVYLFCGVLGCCKFYEGEKGGKEDDNTSFQELRSQPVSAKACKQKSGHGNKKIRFKSMYIFFFFNLKILPQGQAWKQTGYKDHHYQVHFSCNLFLLASDFIHYELLLEILILIELVNIGETFLNLTWWSVQKKEVWNNWAADSVQFSIDKNSLQIGDVRLFVKTGVQLCLLMFSESKMPVKKCKKWAEQPEKNNP